MTAYQEFGHVLHGLFKRAEALELKAQAVPHGEVSRELVAAAVEVRQALQYAEEVYDRVWKQLSPGQREAA